MAMTKEHRALIFQEGVVFIIAGALSIIISLIYDVTRAPVLAWLLIAVGAFKMTQLLFQDRGRVFWIIAAIAAVYLGIGIWLVSQPGMGSTLFSVALSILFGVQAILFCVQGWHWRTGCHCWVYLVLAGLISAALAALIWAGWAESHVWIVGLLVGVQLITYGIALDIASSPFWSHKK